MHVGNSERHSTEMSRSLAGTRELERRSKRAWRGKRLRPLETESALESLKLLAEESTSLGGGNGGSGKPWSPVNASRTSGPEIGRVTGGLGEEGNWGHGWGNAWWKTS